MDAYAPDSFDTSMVTSVSSISASIDGHDMSPSSHVLSLGRLKTFPWQSSTRQLNVRNQNPLATFSAKWLSGSIWSVTGLLLDEFTTTLQSFGHWKLCTLTCGQFEVLYFRMRCTVELDLTLKQSLILTVKSVVAVRQTDDIRCQWCPSPNVTNRPSNSLITLSTSSTH